MPRPRPEYCPPQRPLQYPPMEPPQHIQHRIPQPRPGHFPPGLIQPISSDHREQLPDRAGHGYLRPVTEPGYIVSSPRAGRFVVAENGTAMSRRKQSKPRQIKRSIGDLEEGKDHPPDEFSLSEDASDQEEGDCSPPHAPLHSEGPRTPDTAGTPGHKEEEKSPTHSGEEEDEAEPYWDGPDELHLSSVGGVRKILARQDLAPHTTWGPYSGQQGEGQDGETLGLTLVSTDTELWWKKLPVTSNHTAANCTIFSQGGNLYCKVTQAVHMGACLLARLPEPMHTETHNAPVKEEPELPCPEMQLLPQQAGMATILATAVINKDIFLCKACGIWYRSERNLQAHLMYYCASRKQEPASPPLDYPKEHICAFAPCNKSCPSASALEIHTRTHSGVREDCGVLCQVCGFAVDSPALLQWHARTHVEVRSPAPQQSPSSSESTEPARAASPDSHPPRVNAAPATPREGSPPSVRIKEEPQTDSGNKAPASRCSSPKTQPSTQVKVELPSATPGSSPGPQGAGGTGFLPQASEILAKMSEMVHIRLKQGHAPATPVCHTLATPVHKGATCFECNITFNNINNFYVHKRLYCSSRQRQGAMVAATPTTVPTAMPRVKEGAESLVTDTGLSSSPDAPTPCSVSEVQPGATAAEAEPVDVKREEPVDVKGEEPVDVKGEEQGLGEALRSEGENCERVSKASEGSQSPGGSDEEVDDPNTTFCQACNIRFSRHDNYTVHKRFYCASRHPSNLWPHAGNTGSPPQPAHTRKRKKVYEIHTMAGSGSTPDPVPPPGLSSAPSCHTQGDGPIDLRKRPRPQAPTSPHCPPQRLPPGRVVMGDLMEHVRTVHSLVRPRQARGSPPGRASPGQSEPGPWTEALHRPGLKLCPHSLNSHASPSSPLLSGCPRNGNPVPHHCWLCNIRFSSLSTFIAHRKYYCSSHSAEHVK
ncbi:hypothetical protein AAFF_G00383340 [Aldrovandia affinis]|uniref:Zinc finger protein ZFPM1 n=1 Tax=Aldrovandia affinis TaxID=143900 RepID=A0AAD7T8M7_9TELE|nr:hypothetical protein AAFF_G00383340 [Aldrovandia affinis]